MLALLFALLGPPARQQPALVYNGRANQTAVKPPRLDEAVKIDGELTEPVWQQAALLTGFSQYTPHDGLPAEDSTEVLVWYSPTAMYFGVRAFAKPGTVHATLADRDKIYSDDYVGLMISTFNDKRQATEFDVNPLGIQGDGIIVETVQTASSFNGLSITRPQADLSPDYVFESKGHVTPWGYEIEIRIPFKSLKYQSADPQTWGINVIRMVQSRGFEDSWAPARKSASYLGQFGTLDSLSDLHRGVVLDVNPFVTSHSNGAPSLDGSYRYDTQRPSLGSNVRWGVTNNLTLNGTIKPDFAEVESDAGQIQTDPRNAIFFPEKRPFFLDGLEQFATPNNIIYTRQIAEPVAAGKLTGKVAGTSVALLSAVDDKELSLTGPNNPIFNILRVQRDIGHASKLGFVYTDREDGSSANRVGGLDANIVFGSIYRATMQFVASQTVEPGADRGLSPLWQAQFARAGHHFAFNYSINAISPNFLDRSGFTSRRNVANGSIDHSWTFYGAPGALIETFNTDVSVNNTWQYTSLVNGRAWEDARLHFNENFRLHGGWRVGGSVLIESYGYDKNFYAPYYIERRTATGIDTVKFTGVTHIPNLDWLVQIGSPIYKKYDFSIFWLWGHDENFYEWASAAIGWAQLAGNWRPTDKLRVNATYNETYYRRRTDNTLAGDLRIPRVKVEYQLARPLFVRVVGEYDVTYRDSLRDDSRTNQPLLYRNPDGTFSRLGAIRDYRFHGEGLLAYQPTPGTVFFFGYGSNYVEPSELAFAGLRRTDDRLFIKMSYLWRM